MPVRIAHTVPAAAGIVLLFTGWLAARGSTVEQLWRTFLIWCAPLLVCPPLLSKDAWAYLEQGWIVLQGFDPYQTGLGTIGGPFDDRVDCYWQGTTTVYPPLALLVQAVVALSADPFWSLHDAAAGVWPVLIGACPGLPGPPGRTRQVRCGSGGQPAAGGALRRRRPQRRLGGRARGRHLAGRPLAGRLAAGLRAGRAGDGQAADRADDGGGRAGRSRGGPRCHRGRPGANDRPGVVAAAGQVGGHAGRLRHSDPGRRLGIGWATGSGAPQTASSKSVAHTVAATAVADRGTWPA